MARPIARKDYPSRRLRPLVVALGMLALHACVQVPSGLQPVEQMGLERVANVDVIRTEMRLPRQFSVLYTGPSQSTRTQFPDGFPRSLGSGISLKRHAGDDLEFWVVGDRGPNGDGPAIGSLESKLFPVPDFNPAFGILRMTGKTVEVSAVVDLLRSDGQKMSGLPTPPMAAERVEEIALNEALASLPADAYGIDPEAIAYDGTSLWISDEYGPFVLKVDPASGRVLDRWAPGRGLPAVFAKRRVNRGMECLAFDRSSGKLWGALQSVIDDGAVSFPDKVVRLREAARFIRWVEIDPVTQALHQFAYPIDADDYKKGDTGHAKLGDLAALGGGLFVVIEEGSGANGRYFNRLFLVDANHATDIQQWPGSNLERSSILGHVMNGADWKSVVPLRKRLLLDLNRLGWEHDKAEGLALIDDRTLVVLNDSDFGVMSELIDGHGRRLPGAPEHCLGSGIGPPLFGGRCPHGAVSVRAARMPAASLPQAVWIIRFPLPIGSYRQSDVKTVEF